MVAPSLQIPTRGLQAFPPSAAAELCDEALLFAIGLLQRQARSVAKPPPAAGSFVCGAGDGTQDDVAKLWKGKSSKRRPDTLVLRGLPAKFFEVDMAALEDYEQNGELPTSSSFTSAAASA